MIFVEENDLRFYISKSNLPNAGYGCFAKDFLKKQDWLEIIGIYVKTGGIADLCTHYAERYKFAGSSKMNAKIVPVGFAALINHSNNINLVNCTITYIPGLNKRSEHTGQVVYMFNRDILPGEELIGNYGENIGPTVDKMSENFSFIEENKQDVEEFLSFNLYGLITLK